MEDYHFNHESTLTFKKYYARTNDEWKGYKGESSYLENKNKSKEVKGYHQEKEKKKKKKLLGDSDFYCNYYNKKPFR